MLWADMHDWHRHDRVSSFCSVLACRVPWHLAYERSKPCIEMGVHFVVCGQQYAHKISKKKKMIESDCPAACNKQQLAPSPVRPTGRCVHFIKSAVGRLIIPWLAVGATVSGAQPLREALHHAVCRAVLLVEEDEPRLRGPRRGNKHDMGYDYLFGIYTGEEIFGT